MAKKILLGFAALFILLAGTLAIFVARFDPNQYKAQLVALVKEQKQRTLHIDGDIKLGIFPKLGVELGRTSISERNSEAVFASVDEVRLSVALLPLLARDLVIDQVVLRGLKAKVVRDKAGRSNIDDLAGKSEAGAPQSGTALKFDIAGVRIDNADLAWRDEASGAAYTLTQLNLRTGRIAPGQTIDLDLQAAISSTQPQARVTVSMRGGALFDPATQRYGVSKLDLNVAGAALGLQNLKVMAKGNAALDLATQNITADDFKVELSGTQGANPIEFKLDAPKLAIGPKGASGNAVSGTVKLAGAQNVELKFNASAPGGTAEALTIARLAIELRQKQGEREVIASLATPVTANLAQRSMTFQNFAGDLAITDPALPKKSLRIPLSGTLRADALKETIAAALQARFEEGSLNGKFNVAGFASPAVQFDVDIDQLNVDHYVPPAPPAAPATPAAAAKPEAPFSMAFLKDLTLNGQVRIGKLQVHNIKLAKLALAARAGGGRLDVSNITAQLYQGTLAASASITASNQFSLRNTLSDIAIGPLLQDAARQDMLEGRGTVVLDVGTSGMTVSALKSALAGSASVKLRDGAVKGINVAQTLRDFKSTLGMAKNQTQGADKNARTDFSDLSATFAIRNGVASNKDLSARSPLLRLTGAGDIDIGKSSMDYVARAMLVNTTSGQDGKALAQLKDVTVPVRIHGPLDKLSYEVQWASITSDALKSGLKDRLLDRLAPQPKSGASTAPAPAPQDQLKQQLKGLFGR